MAKEPAAFNRRFLFMKKLGKKLASQSVLRLQNHRHPGAAGNVLIYVVVVMLIFGVLGVIMASLFTSSTASTVTRNDTRRAIYMAESGMRYAFSELRKADFDEDFIINTLNTVDYKITNAGSFTINVFSPWFDSKSDINGIAQIPLAIRLGEIPPGFTASPGVFLVNYEYVGNSPVATGIASINNVQGQTLTEITYNLNDPIIATKDERICFAVHPKGLGSQSVQDGSNLIVDLEARDIFPKYGGAIDINRNDYYYEERVDDEDNNQVILRNISVPPESTNMSVDSTYYVVLSPRNYLVVPTGTSDAVTYGGNYLFGKGIYDSSLIRPGSRKPDITAEKLASNLSEQETGTDFFQTDLVEGTLAIGGGGTGQFGSAFFNAKMNIGGEENYCVAGACNFFLGIRAFFLINFINQGDGITFTLTSGPPQNSASSAGGDIQLSELMGYAGDSRTDAAGTTFLTTDAADHGLDPPKFAVEFDTRTNNMAGDPPPDYCADPSTVNTNSRNDPLTGNEDAVQYVFWGRANFLDISCRNNNPLYDDNRHDADGEEPTEEWRYGMGGPASVWRPAIGADGTIYASDQVSRLYAFNQDGTLKWTFNLTDGNDYMPGIDRTGGPNDGTIYSDIYGSSLVAINSDGSEKWRFHMTSPSTDIASTPTVGPDGTIYFGTIEAHALIALNPNGTQRWRFVTGDEVNNVAALSPDGTTVYFVSNDNNLYAVNVSSNPAIDGTLKWQFPILTEPNEVNSSPIVNPADGTIYVASDDHKVYALNPTARAAGLPFPQAGEWAFTTGGEVEPSAAIDDHGTPGDKSDDTIYIGSDDRYFYAIRANGTQKWRYQTNAEIVSSAVVDLDRTVYVGSDDGRVYAFNPNGSLKWFFETGAPVQSSPALGQAGFIHIGSNNGNLYTISQFADPRNFKDEGKTSGKLLTVEDLSSGAEVVEVNSTDDWLNGKPGMKGPFAVRLEVDRALTPDANGEYDYELRLWMRQCNDDVLCDNILGTFFQDTRVAYDYSAVPASLPMIQRFALSAADQAKFNKFFFGFTAAAGAQALEATISRFQLSFIRPGDPAVTDDSLNWPP
jgi:outer membrane protein assembly factor BamB/type II secretory pathway pseudopilin PulG